MGLLANQVPQGVPAKNPSQEWPMARKAAVQWLLDNQNEDGGWGSGWSFRGIVHTGSQTSDTAAGVHLLLRLGDGSKEVIDAIHRALTWLLREQLEDGGWSRRKEESKEGAAWHTEAAISALLQALMHRDKLDLTDEQVTRIKRAIERGVQWLLSTQNPDGSWYSGIMCQEYSADTQAYVLSALIDVYLLADQLGLNVDKNKVLQAIRKGIQWLFSSNAGIDWVQTELGKGPAWAYSEAYLQAQGSPETTVTGNVLRLAILKALWFDVGTDVLINTPGGKMRLRDLLTNPDYNIHATIKWLLDQQWLDDALQRGHPEWYGGWPWPARGVTSTVEGASYEPASIWATSFATRAIEAYLNPTEYYGPSKASKERSTKQKEEREGRGRVSGETKGGTKVSGETKETKKRGRPGVPVIPVPPLAPARRQREQRDQRQHR